MGLVKLTFFILASLCYLHALRDYLQMRGIRNWLTVTGHFWSAPDLEKYSLAFFLVVGSVLLYLGFRTT